MSEIALELQSRSWIKSPFFISTDPKLIPIAKLNTFFATKAMYWALPMPEEYVKAMLENSLSFGLYLQKSSSSSSSSSSAPPATPLQDEVESAKQKFELIGYARCVTDYTTLIYLTDVYVEETHQGKGLGKWLIGCINEVIADMPWLRRSMLITSDWQRTVPYYRQHMDMEVVEGKGEGVVFMTKTGPGLPPDFV